MNYLFHPEAKKELKRAVKYYNKCGGGLGYIFLDEIQDTIQRIIQFPNSWSKLSEYTRRCLTRRFPYGIIYQIVDHENILIIAVMHMSRKPDYWKNRLED
ncbi:MAG: type II toxin-antitoxin system RelE/ParE family toxin [bacterium]|nr:type II toxin-antitoxin system RelE/ParE family toxin [bacterium]